MVRGLEAARPQGGGRQLVRGTWPITAGAMLVAAGTWAGFVPAAIGLAGMACGMVVLAATSTIAGRSLRTTADRQAIATSISGDGVWVYDLRTSKITYDDRCAQTLGYDRGHVADRLSAWGKLVHPDDLAPARDALDAFVAGETDRYEVVVRLRDVRGCWRKILDRGRIVERAEDGRPLVLMGIHRLVDGLPDGSVEPSSDSGSPVGPALRSMSRWLLHELHGDLEAMLRRARGQRRKAGDDEWGPSCARAVALSRRLARLDAIETLACDAVALPRRLEDAIARCKQIVPGISIDARLPAELPGVAVDATLVDEGLALVLDELASRSESPVVVRATPSSEAVTLTFRQEAEDDPRAEAPRLRAAASLVALQGGHLRAHDGGIELALPRA